MARINAAGGGGDERGFSLVESIVAMGVLATGLIGLAGVLALGMAHLSGSSANLVAREKAREAIESVHTARDMHATAWAQIRNQAAGGIFLDGPQPLRRAGPDGLVNTADDVGLESSRLPGADGVLGTDDDVESPLSQYTRQIEIADIMVGGVANPNLRELRVTIRYQVGQNARTYALITYVSAIS